MQIVTEPRSISLVEEKIILTLLYFDVFNYPLKADEVFRFLGTNHLTESDVRKDLIELKRKKIIYQFDELFSIQNSEFNAVRRLRGNSQAEKYLPLARRKAMLIAKFPFVRGVLASGSLAKGYMDDNSDLDFFIITEPKRLWIARTLLVMYKRIFLFNSHKHFCVNYFIDSDHLEIEEKNLFTATELATAIPLYGTSYYKSLHRNNTWVNSAFPNFRPLSTEGVDEFKPGWMKKALEKLFNIFFAERIESYFKSVTIKRWKRIYEDKYAGTDFQIAFKSKEHVSKNHPNHYQRKVEDQYLNKVRAFKVKLESRWSYV
jgi:hypothetical protein